MKKIRVTRWILAIFSLCLAIIMTYNALGVYITDDIGLVISATDSQSAINGYDVKFFNDTTIINITFTASVTATKCYVAYQSNQSVIYNGSCTNINLPVLANVDYWIGGGKDGLSYVATYSVTPNYVHNTTLTSFITGLWGGGGLWGIYPTPSIATTIQSITLFVPDQIPPSEVNVTTNACNNLTLGSARNITINWTNATGGTPITYTVYAQDYPLNIFSDNIFENTTLNTFTWNSSVWNPELSVGYYQFRVASNNNIGQNDSYSCIFYVCENSWSRTTQPCVSDTRLISYTDVNNCNEALNVPANNGTYESCHAVTYVQNSWSEDVLLLIILFFFLVISTVCAVTIHEAFFGVNALLTTIIWVVFRYYNYPQMTTLICAVMIASFSVMWVIVHKVKN